MEYTRETSHWKCSLYKKKKLATIKKIIKTFMKPNYGKLLEQDYISTNFIEIDKPYLI